MLIMLYLIVSLLREGVEKTEKLFKVKDKRHRIKGIITGLPPLHSFGG